MITTLTPIPLLVASCRQWSPIAFAVAKLIWFFSFTSSAALPFCTTSPSDAAMPDDANAMAAAAANNAT